MDYRICQSFRQLWTELTRLLVKPRVIMLLMIGLAIALVSYFTPLKAVFDPGLLKNFARQYEGYVELIFVSGYIALTIVGIPGTVLTLVGGCLFGIWYGTVVSIVSATLGALGAFWFARYLLHDYVQRRLSRNKKLNKFQGEVLQQPFTSVLVTRLVPISPFNLVNYLFGLTKISWWDYATATFVGVIPGCFVYTWLGKSGEVALMGGDRLSFMLALTFLAVLSIVPLIYQRRSQA